VALDTRGDTNPGVGVDIGENVGVIGEEVDVGPDVGGGTEEVGVGCEVGVGGKEVTEGGGERGVPQSKPRNLTPQHLLTLLCTTSII
jgi:hypothetical protein